MLTSFNVNLTFRHMDRHQLVRHLELVECGRNRLPGSHDQRFAHALALPRIDLHESNLLYLTAEPGF